MWREVAGLWGDLIVRAQVCLDGREAGIWLWLLLSVPEAFLGHLQAQGSTDLFAQE